MHVRYSVSPPIPVTHIQKAVTQIAEQGWRVTTLAFCPIAVQTSRIATAKQSPVYCYHILAECEYDPLTQPEPAPLTLNLE